MLEICGIVKKINETRVIDGLELCTEENGLYCLLMPDVHTSSVLANVVCAIEESDGGEVRVNGERLSRDNVRARRKIRLADPALVLFPSTKVIEYLKFVGEALALPKDKLSRQTEQAIALVGLDGKERASCARLSECDKVRLAIAAALIGGPSCIVISAGDWQASAKTDAALMDLLALLGEKKTVIVLSCDPLFARILGVSMKFVKDGKIAFSGTASQIEEKINSTHQLAISARGDKDKIIELLSGLDGVISVSITDSKLNDVHSIMIEHVPNAAFKDIAFYALKEIDVPMLSAKSIVLTLEDVYYSINNKKARAGSYAENSKNGRGGK